MKLLNISSNGDFGAHLLSSTQVDLLIVIYTMSSAHLPSNYRRPKCSSFIKTPYLQHTRTPDACYSVLGSKYVG